MNNPNVEKLIIIGSGPAGLTAAIYAARGNLNPLVISGRAAGGQLMLTTDVDDFPGFPKGIQGPELVGRMRKQAERFKTRFINEDVISVDLKSSPFVIKTETGILYAATLIIATGSSAKWLGLESEYRFIGKGVSACAVCDGFFFKDKNVMVVGGGDAAMREAQHLAKICKKVTVVVRKGELRAQTALQNLVKSKPNVDLLFNTTIEEFLGQEKLEKVRIKNIQTGKTKEVPIDGVFIAIGHNPNIDFLKGQLELDERGYVVIKGDPRNLAKDGTYTSVAGVFAAGDITDFHYRQGVTAAGSGCKAALDVEEYLETSKQLVKIN